MITKQDWLAHRPWIDFDDVDVEAYVESVEAPKDYDLGAKLAQWRDDGIVVFEQAVDAGLIDRFKQDVDYLMNHHSEFDLVVELKGRHYPIRELSREQLHSPQIKFNNIQTISQAAAELSLTKAVCSFLGHVFQEHPAVLQTLTFFKGSQQPVHLDYPYVRNQTKVSHLAASWVALEDIHPDSGPLRYYPGSHKLPVCGFFDWGGGSILREDDSTREPIEFSRYLEERLARSALEGAQFCPRKGDVLIWHGFLAHEGTTIADERRTRRSLVTHYTSLGAYPDTHLRPQALAKGHLVALNGGCAFDYPWLPMCRKRLPSYSDTH